MSWWWSNFRS